MMLRRKVSLLTIVTTALVGLSLGAGAVIFNAAESGGPAPIKTYYVSPTGSDTTGDGSIGNPFQTLNKSRLAVASRDKSGEGVGPIAVYLREGVYEQTSRLDFGPDDSGTVANPIIYRSYPGEHAVISGAKKVTDTTALSDPNILNRLPVAARSAVVSIDLTTNGLTAGDPLKGTGSTFNPTWPIFIAQNGTSLQLARYPEATDPWERIANVTDINGTFQYTDAEPSNWASYTDIQIHSFPQWDWADFRDTIETLDPATKTIKVVGSDHSYARYLKANTQGTLGIYYYENVLERLNAPGKYYIDRANGKVYVWPPQADLTSYPLLAATTEGLIKTNGTSYVKFVDLEIAYNRGGYNININNSHHLDFHNVTVHDISGINAFRTILNSHDINITSSHFYDTGGTAINLDCGDKSFTGSLSSGNCAIANSTIERVGTDFISGSSGALLNGVGNRIVFSAVNDSPSMAIGVSGNNQMVEYNSISNPANLVNDGGAIYQGRQIVERGSTIRYNRIDNAVGRNNVTARGIYLDDGQPGYQIYGNLLNDVSEPFFISGPDTSLSNNLIISPDSSYNPMTLDNGNYGWRAYSYPSGIASVSQTYPYVVTTIRPHGMDSWAYDKTKQIKLEGITAMPSLNGTWTASNITATTFQIDAPETTWSAVSDGLLITGWTKFVDDFKATQDKSAFTNAYPELYARELKDMYKMVNLTVSKNAFYLGNRQVAWDVGINADVRPGTTSSDNTTVAASDFVDYAGGDFTFKAGTPALAAGFVNLPLNLMGPRNSAQFLTGLESQTIKAGQTATLSIGTEFMTEHGFTSDLYVRNLPDTATYDTTTKTITWTPQTADIGVKTISIESLGSVYASVTTTLTVVAADADNTDDGTGNTGNTGDGQGNTSTGSTGSTGTTGTSGSGTTGSSGSTPRRSTSSSTPRSSTGTSVNSDGTTATTTTPTTAPVVNEFRLDTPAKEEKVSVLGMKYVLGSASLATILLGLFLLWRYYRMNKNMIDTSNSTEA